MNAALARVSAQFDTIYGPRGHDSIPLEKLPRALLLRALFPVRSERQLVEQVTYGMLSCWFVGLSIDAPA